MTVKELIEKLKELDQEREIWIFYDYPYAALEPRIDGEVDEEQAARFASKGVVEGDYYIDI